MRADQLLMAGVVLIGGYAIYRLIASPSTGAAPAPGSMPLGSGVPLVTPASFSPPTGSTTVLGDQLGFVQGRWYGGVVELGAPGAIAPPNATPAELAAALAAYGFGGSAARPDAPGSVPLEIFASAADAKAHVPAYALPAAPSPTVRWFVARWASPSQSRPRPAWLPLLWATVAPKPQAIRFGAAPEIATPDARMTPFWARVLPAFGLDVRDQPSSVKGEAILASAPAGSFVHVLRTGIPDLELGGAWWLVDAAGVRGFVQAVDRDGSFSLQPLRPLGRQTGTARPAISATSAEAFARWQYAIAYHQAPVIQNALYLQYLKLRSAGA